MGWLNTARNLVTGITFIVAVGFGSTQANAIAGVNNTLTQNRPMLHPCMTRPPSTLRDGVPLLKVRCGRLVVA
jgi:hypothetical protein